MPSSIQKIWFVVKEPLIFCLIQVVLVIIATILLMVVFGSYVLISGHNPFTNIDELLMAPWFVLLTGTVHIVLVILGFLIFTLWRKKGSTIKEFYGLKPVGRNRAVLYIILGAGLYYSTYGLITMLGHIGLYVHEPLFPAGPLSPATVLLFSILLTGIALPIVEEGIFRGVILRKLLAVSSPVTAVLASSLLFSLVHLNMYQIPYTFLFGILFSILYLWTRSLWGPVIVHMVNNLNACFLAFILQLSGQTILDIKTHIIFFCAGGAAVAYALIKLSRNRIPAVGDPVPEKMDPQEETNMLP